MASIESDCNTCCSTLSYRNKSVVCPYCKYTCCVEGIRKTLCNIELSPQPLCPEPKCKKFWNREFLINNLTKTWYDGPYKEHRKRVLIDREKSMLPTAQIEVERMKERSKKNAELGKIRHNKDEITLKIAGLRMEIKNLKLGLTTAIDKKIAKAEVKAKQAELATNLQLRKVVETTIREFNTGGGEEVKQERREFIQSCPGDNCKGFLSSVWKCSLCDKWSCSQCGCIKGNLKDSEHKCDPQIKESFQLIKKETTNCPGCSACVSRVSGCDQMWCVQCHTAFSYKTGQIIAGRIHNPHFVEWKTTNGDVKREVMDVQCGGTPELDVLRRKLKVVFNKNIPPTFKRMYQKVIHTSDVLIPNYVVHQNQNRNMNLRIQYLMNNITEDKWKAQLLKDEKQNQKKEEICLVFQAFRDAGNDILLRMVDIKTPAEYNDLYSEYKKLCEFIIVGMKAVLKSYESSQQMVESFLRGLVDDD